MCFHQCGLGGAIVRLVNSWEVSLLNGHYYKVDWNKTSSDSYEITTYKCELNLFPKDDNLIKKKNVSTYICISEDEAEKVFNNMIRTVQKMLIYENQRYKVLVTTMLEDIGISITDN